MPMKFQGFTYPHVFNGKNVPEHPIGDAFDTLDEAIAQATEPDDVGDCVITERSPAFAKGKITFLNSRFYPKGFELEFFIRLCHA